MASIAISAGSMSARANNAQQDLERAPPIVSIEQDCNSSEKDAYIHHLQSENDRLSKVNDELNRMWLTHIAGQQAESRLGLTSESELEHERLDWNKLYALLEESVDNTSQKHQPDQSIPVTQEKKRSRVGSIISGALFYLLMLTLVLGAFFFAGSSENSAGPPQNIAGFSAMTVLTRSMQSTIPQHSLIITRQVDPNTIQVGDDITFLVSANMTITHRVIEVVPNFEGERGFRTQGTDNLHPDANIVPASNVIGLVIFRSLPLGNAILFIRNNVVMIVIAIAVVVAVFIAAKFLLFKKVPTMKGHEGFNVP